MRSVALVYRAFLRRLRPSFFTFEIALDSSRRALSPYTVFGSCRWLEQKHEVAVLVREFRCAGHTAGRGAGPAGGAPGGG
ncbi:hypothetical protein F511_25076 [Dorcoceras hygrometricum]|uniref:Uncharacterized protein n=1 Tax=Dorcoceras hygrometricum TaxID=472368 RepID=A0A2Z7CEA7_9LAMI|nr:hypothetical protein F511_25076 [Dorcoceras hygrometricum]